MSKLTLVKVEKYDIEKESVVCVFEKCLFVAVLTPARSMGLDVYFSVSWQ